MKALRDQPIPHIMYFKDQTKAGQILLSVISASTRNLQEDRKKISF